MRLGDGLLKGVKVDDDQINQANAVRLGLGEVFGLVAPAEQAAVDFGVQRLEAALHHLGKAGVFAHVRDREARLAQQLGGAAGRKQLVAATRERAGEVGEAGFVADGEQGAFFHTPPVLARRPGRQEGKTYTTMNFRITGFSSIHWFPYAPLGHRS